MQPTVQISSLPPFSPTSSTSSPTSAVAASALGTSLSYSDGTNSTPSSLSHIGGSGPFNSLVWGTYTLWNNIKQIIAFNLYMSPPLCNVFTRCEISGFIIQPRWLMDDFYFSSWVLWQPEDAHDFEDWFDFRGQELPVQDGLFLCVCSSHHCPFLSWTDNEDTFAKY